MELSIIDSIIIVCRSIFDVLHFVIYSVLIVIAIIFAIYKYDKKTFNDRIYLPYIKRVVDKNFKLPKKYKKRI